MGINLHVDDDSDRFREVHLQDGWQAIDTILSLDEIGGIADTIRKEL